MTNFQYFMECSDGVENERSWREAEALQLEQEEATQAEYERQIMESYDTYCVEEQNATR